MTAGSLTVHVFWNPLLPVDGVFMLSRSSGHMERPGVGAAAESLCPGARQVSWDTSHNSIF